MKDKTQTEAAIRYAVGLFDGLIIRLNADDGHAFNRYLESVLLAVGDIGRARAYESELARPESTKTLAQKTTALCDEAVMAGALSLERKKQLKRIGLDPKYIGIRSADELEDL